jgi:hypothetical protein
MIIHPHNHSATRTTQDVAGNAVSFHQKENPMQNLRNKLIAGGAVLILAAIGTIMNSHPALGQSGGPTITIDPAQLPLPVKGSTTVSGAVAATQSGPWSVGISGTPNVNVTGTPNVDVVNPATAPALFLNVNDPGRIPYQSQQLCPAGSGSACQANFPIVPPRS